MLVTGLLVLVGFALYLNDRVGWAQFLWVLASGTAGGGVMMLVEHKGDH